MKTKKIVLDFKQQPIVGKGFQYKIYVGDTLLTYENSLDYLDLSYKSGGNNAPFQIGLGSNLSNTIDNTLAFLQSGYEFDGFCGGYGATVSYARVNNTIEVTITCDISDSSPYMGISFFEMISDYDYVSLRTDTPCVFAYLNNQTVSSYASINALPEGFYFLKNNDLNTYVAEMHVPNVFELNLVRGYSYSILDKDTFEILFTFTIYPSVTTYNVFSSVTNNQLIINISGINGYVESNYLFSIDGTTYQSSNVFDGLDIGMYTYYIKDSLGCIKTFTIYNDGSTNSNINTPYTYISESNSIRFANRVVHQNCGNYKNVFNTLSCEENVAIANKYLQLFQTCDTIKTQIKTSYDNVEVYAKDSDGTFTEIIAEKIVNNIQVEDKRDCNYFSYNGKLCVYYTNGNTYNYDTTTVSGTYQLNGTLPDYGVVGTWIETEYGTFQISNVVILDSGYRAIVFDFNITLSDVVVGTIQTIYNRETYNIWEFDTDMSLFTDKTITIGIRFYQTTTDVAFPDVYFLSEKILVKDRHPRSIEVVWSNSKNTDIYFYSGIQMKNRLNFAFINTQLSDGEIQIQRTDSQVIPIDATNYNAVEFVLLALTTGMVRKMKLALKHDNLVIEGIPYVLAESVNTERQGESNFYKLTAKLLEAGDVWNQGTANTQTVISNVELIGLLQGDNDAEYQRIQ